MSKIPTGFEAHLFSPIRHVRLTVPSNCSKAGALLFVGSVQFGTFLMLAEAVSPGYSLQLNYISDLGSTFPASAPIFNSSIVLFGALVLGSAYYLQRAFGWLPLSGLIAFSGIGLLGVGLFPEGSSFALHDLFSFLTFLFSGLAAVVAARFQRAPLSCFSVILGSTTLAAMILYVPGTGSFGTMIGIGVGGLERMIVYPVLFWSIGFSGHLIGMEDRAST